MAQWRVTQGDNQFTVEGLPELIAMAQRGDLQAGDMIQPPEAEDWVYATEVPALAPHFKGGDDDDDLDGYKPGGAMKAIIPMMIVVGLLGFIGLGGLGILVLVQYLPDGDEVLVGDGGLTYSQMIVTNEGVSLHSKPDANSSAVTSVAKDSTLELLAKRGEFYRARTESGDEGWIAVTAVLPMYQLGGEKVQKKYDPLYNPDHYVDVANASWMQLPDQDELDEKVTIFHFMFRNKSAYDMTDLVIVTTIKNAKGGVIEEIEIPIEGEIPTSESTMVGTLAPPKDAPEGTPKRFITEATFKGLAANDPDMQERWSPGLEVTMTSQDFDNANVDIVELRAVPDAKAAGDVRR
ncbi:MAG: SH3 domain-containing protein [Alphaproteobacteria bacterium]|nr:SH3 domain-containing protein [Phycisphaerales bacterium]MCB9677264.1 SH3 domain-containing protein [Alphaproteobacteria bacterium]